MSRLSLYIRLVRLHKPIGILLLLWPTLTALWLASDGHPNWMVVAIFTAGTVLMRSAGCAINDVADKDFDKHVKRTAKRPHTNNKNHTQKTHKKTTQHTQNTNKKNRPLNALTKLLSVAAVLI